MDGKSHEEAWRAGMEAVDDGLASAINPHRVGSQLATGWADEWLEGERLQRIRPVRARRQAGVTPDRWRQRSRRRFCKASSRATGCRRAGSRW